MSRNHDTERRMPRCRQITTRANFFHPVALRADGAPGSTRVCRRRAHPLPLPDRLRLPDHRRTEIVPPAGGDAPEEVERKHDVRRKAVIFRSFSGAAHRAAIRPSPHFLATQADSRLPRRSPVVPSLPVRADAWPFLSPAARVPACHKEARTHIHEEEADMYIGGGALALIIIIVLLIWLL